MTSPVLSQVLLSLALVVLIARIGGFLFERIGQPAVVGEIVAGIAAGPSLLGLIAPGLSRDIVPAAALPYLNLIAQLGLVIFMLVVGLEVEEFGRRAKTVGAVALGATLLPFGLGVVVAALVWPWYSVSAGRGPFVLFVGVAVAITAFPVLSRIVRDRGLSGTKIGTIALACAAVIDAAAWLVLAAVIALVSHTGRSPWAVLGLVTVFVLVMLLVVRPLLRRATFLDRVPPTTLLVFVLVAAVLAAWFTNSLGLHSIFGPFIVGLSLPRLPALIELVTVRAADLSAGLLLPAFFVVAGLGVRVTSLSVRDLIVLAVFIVASVVGKVAGAYLPALFTGLSRGESATLAVLLNARGLTELVVLSVGLAAGLLTTGLYTVLVINAVVTTVITGPLLTLLDKSLHREIVWTPAST